MTKQKLQTTLRIILAIILGEIILVLGTTAVQEGIFDGIGWYSSGKTELILGGAGSVLAAVIAGIVAFSIVKKANDIPLIVLSVLVILETIWLIQTGRTEDPVWFDALAGASLIAGFWVGRWGVVTWI